MDSPRRTMDDALLSDDDNSLFGILGGGPITRRKSSSNNHNDMSPENVTKDAEASDQKKEKNSKTSSPEPSSDQKLPAVSLPQQHSGTKPKDKTTDGKEENKTKIEVSPLPNKATKTVSASVDISPLPATNPVAAAAVESKKKSNNILDFSSDDDDVYTDGNDEEESSEDIIETGEESTITSLTDDAGLLSSTESSEEDDGEEESSEEDEEEEDDAEESSEVPETQQDESMILEETSKPGAQLAEPSAEKPTLSATEESNDDDVEESNEIAVPETQQDESTNVEETPKQDTQLAEPSSEKPPLSATEESNGDDDAEESNEIAVPETQQDESMMVEETPKRGTQMAEPSAEKPPLSATEESNDDDNAEESNEIAVPETQQDESMIAEETSKRGTELAEPSAEEEPSNETPVPEIQQDGSDVEETTKQETQIEEEPSAEEEKQSSLPIIINDNLEVISGSDRTTNDEEEISFAQLNKIHQLLPEKRPSQSSQSLVVDDVVQQQDEDEDEASNNAEEKEKTKESSEEDDEENANSPSPPNPAKATSSSSNDNKDESEHHEASETNETTAGKDDAEGNEATAAAAAAAVSSFVKFIEPVDHSEVNENDSNDSSEEDESSDGEEEENELAGYTEDLKGGGDSSEEEESDEEEVQQTEREEEDDDEEEGGKRQSRPSIPPNVESIEIAAEATSIPESAFENCEHLKTVTFPPDSQVQSIGEGAFFKCEALLEMHFPQHLEVIAQEAFLGCAELRKIQFASPETLQRIEKYAFYCCKQLIEIVNLPEDFDGIGRNAFYGCFKAQGYPKGADPNIFLYTGEDEGEVDVPEDVTHVKIGEICEVIPKKTFMYRHQLIQVDFRSAENLKTIEKHAFYRCDNLRDANLSSTQLHSIGQKAFFGCKSLTSICPPKTLMLVDGDALNFSGYYLYRGDTDEMVPADMKHVRVGGNVSSLKKEAFVQCEKLHEVMLKDAIGLTSIGEEAFYYSESLAEISLPTNVRIVERAAFLGCSSLAKVSLNTYLEIIGDEAFEACTSLRMIALTENVQVIGDSAFYACAKLKTVRVNDALRVIGQEAFMLCKSLANITLPSGLNSLGENAFDQCSNLEWINLSGPDNLPLSIHIRVKYEDEAGEKLKMNSLMEMYSQMPIDASKLISDSDEELQLLDEIKAAYLLIELDRIAKIPNRERDNGFVQFLSHHVDDQSAESLVGFLQTASVESVQRLANAKDYAGNSALQVARPPVVQAFQERLMFLGRYGLQEEPVVRKSDNSIVVEALDYKMEEFYEGGFDRWSLAETLDDELFCRALEDLFLIPLENSFAVSKEYFKKVDHKNAGEISKELFLSFCIEQFGRKVVLKFFCNEDQYQRELDRNGVDLDGRYVLRMLRRHDIRVTPGMAEALPGFIGLYLSDGESPSNYCRLIVYPRGERDLETIYRYEKPDGLEIKSLLLEVGKALSHLHDNGLVHGNLRMSKIIRQNGHIKLLDLAASAVIGSEPLGLKVSSGVLPPEMIHAILNKGGCDQLREYYKNANSKTKASRAPKISNMPSKLWCVARAFLTDKKGKSFSPRTEGLPYELLYASPSVDVWSFGALVYACCTGHSLFKVTYRDSIEDGNSLRVLWDWNDIDLDASLEDVKEDETKDLLRSLLQRKESMRPSMNEVLRHPFFDPDTKIQDWKSTSTAPTPTPHYDYVTGLNDELETPHISNKKSVPSSRLKNVPDVNKINGEEESVSLLDYNELSKEVDNLKAELKKTMVASTRSEEDSVTLSEYKKLTEEVALLRDELKKSRKGINSHQGLNQHDSAPNPAPNHMAFHDVKIVCEGWLQKRRYDKRSLWKNRYFVSYEDGTVTYFQNASELNDPTKGGCAFHLVRFRKPDEESQDTFELQTVQGEPIMQLRLSPLTISTVDDWLGAKQHEDNSVVHKGWLQKQSRKHKQLWSDRYFVLNKTGYVMYYANAVDANNPSAGGATFARVKWEHVTDKTMKEDFDLKTMNGELIMKLRLSKLSSSSIDDWMKGNEWFEKSKRVQSPTSDDNIENHFELAGSSEAPVYEIEAATFSGISEMGHTYDEVRLSGNIAVPQEVGNNTMEAIREKKENSTNNDSQDVSDIVDGLSDDVEDSYTKELSDTNLREEKQGAADEPREKKESTGEELGDGQIVNEIGDALPDEEEVEFMEGPNADLPDEKQGAEDEANEKKETTRIELGDSQVADEIGDELPDEEEYVKAENNQSTENDNGADEKPIEQEQISEKASHADAIQENQDLKDEPDEEEKGTEGEPNNANDVQEVKKKDGENGGLDQVAEKETTDTVDDVPKDGGIAKKSHGDGIQPVKEEKLVEGEPRDASTAVPGVQEKDDLPKGGDITNDKDNAVQTAQEETKGNDGSEDTTVYEKDITNGISKAFQLFKRKVAKKKPEEVDDNEQRGGDVSVDGGATYDYNDGAVPRRFSGRSNQLLAPVSTVNFAGEVSCRSDDDEVTPAAQPKPAEQPTGKSAAQKLGEKIPKLVSQFTDRIQLDAKARRKKRRDEMKRKKRVSMQRYTSSD